MKHRLIPKYHAETTGNVMPVNSHVYARKYSAEKFQNEIPYYNTSIRSPRLLLKHCQLAKLPYQGNKLFLYIACTIIAVTVYRKP